MTAMSKDIEYIKENQDDLKKAMESLETAISGKFKESFGRIDELESNQDKFVGAGKIIGFIIVAAISIAAIMAAI